MVRLTHPNTELQGNFFYQVKGFSLFLEVGCNGAPSFLYHSPMTGVDNTVYV